MTLTPGQSQYAYPGREQCNIFSIPLILENHGRPVNGVPPRLFWSREFLDQQCPATGPSDQYPGEPGNKAECNYWEFKPGTIEGTAPWTLMDYVTLDDNYLTFTWNDCFYKFGAINTLYPPGSQIVISFSKRYSSGDELVWDPTGSEEDPSPIPSGGTFGAHYWPGCVTFVTDQYERDSDAEEGPGELKLRVNQFRSVLRGEEAAGGIPGEGDPTFWQLFCNGVKYTCGYSGAPGGDICDTEDERDIEFNFSDYEGSSEDSTNDALYRFGRDLSYAYYERNQRLIEQRYDPDDPENPWGDIFSALRSCLTENQILRNIDFAFPGVPPLPPPGAENSDNPTRGCCGGVGIMMDVRICTEAGGRIT